MPVQREVSREERFVRRNRIQYMRYTDRLCHMLYIYSAQITLAFCAELP